MIKLPHNHIKNYYAAIENRLMQEIFQISIVKLQFRKEINTKCHLKIPLNNQISAQMISPPFPIP